MWTVRIVALALIMLMLMTTWRIVRALGAEPLGFIAMMTLGIGSGVMTGSIVLWVSARAEPDERMCPHGRDQVAPDSRAELEAEHGGVGHWTVINGRTCYVVPSTDGWTGDGEELGDGNTWRYWFGDYCSDRQFIVAGVLSDSGAVIRRSPICWWYGYL